MADEQMLVTATIYRDDQQVLSMIQQGVDAGIALESKRSRSGSGKDVATSEHATSGAVRGGVDVPLMGEVGGQGKHSRSSGKTREDGGGWSDDRSYEHTAAGHLHRVLTRLGEAQLIRGIANLQEARDVNVGDFVEFQATFRPNELATMLDVVTPEVAGGIARQVKRAESLSQMDAVDYDDFKGWVEKRKLREDSVAELAALMVRAVQADLRSSQTREYHASVVGTRAPLTAVTVCEADAFVTADPDRLLDGHFTVVGKVISPPRRDVNVLVRSKLLARVQPEALDELQDMLDGLMAEPTTGVAGQVAKTGDVLDLHVASRIRGLSFGVLPIAIYV